MAATARRRDPDEDIAAIAKQISDQAEAIYQNWKSRGLPPSDLITCHAAGDTTKLGSMLKPQPPAKPSIELLAQAPTMDNNRLEKLVKNFVVEDKARIAAATAAAAAAAARNKSMPSSIQFALQKFEKNTQQSDVNQTSLVSSKRNSSSSSSSSPLLLKTAFSNGLNENDLTTPSSPSSSTTSSSLSSNSLKQIVKPAIGLKPQISPKPRLSETIEMVLPSDQSSTTSSTSSSSSSSASSSLSVQSWPLKNRIISTDNVKRTMNEVHHLPTTIKSSAVAAAAAAAASLYMDEVALEEKKLLEALCNEETHSPPPAVAAAAPALAAQSQGQLKGVEVTTKWGVRNTRQRNTTTNNNNEQQQQQQQNVPHPELTVTQRQHLRQTAANPVRPFLTRGSVAERVLIFERCPSDILLDKRVRAPITQLPKAQPLIKQPSLPHTTLQRHVRANRSSNNVHIPRFHFPMGKPTPAAQCEQLRQRIGNAFKTIAATAGGGGAERATREHFSAIATACQLPLYWKTPLYLAACADKGNCTFEQFMTFWNSMSSTCHDAASRFIYILTRGKKNSLCPEDFVPLVQDVVETHPGLTFLKEATEFHSRYVHTVIARIFYCVNRSWSGRITVPELRRSNLLNIIHMLDEEEDINQVTQFFSYEHFYVIYCKFWELDRDHDLFIDKQDMTRHNDHALSKRIIDRIFSGCVTGGQHKTHHDEKLSYCEFVWFLLSEEDKRHPTAIEYWFRCMDLDGDGFLSMYELEYFYQEQMHRMELIGIETLPFEDCLCQMLDMVKPAVPGKIALRDLKKCKMTPIFFDTFFNLEKYLDHEQRDPFASQRDHDYDGQELSDWDRYAAEEYELLVAEEGGTDDPNSLSFDEGNIEDDPLSQNLDVVLDMDAAQCGLSDESDECSI